MSKNIISLMEAVAKNKRIELRKVSWQRISQVDREVKSRKLKPEGAIERMKHEEDLRGRLSEMDWKNIKERIEDMMD